MPKIKSPLNISNKNTKHTCLLTKSFAVQLQSHWTKQLLILHRVQGTVCFVLCSLWRQKRVDICLRSVLIGNKFTCQLADFQAGACLCWLSEASSLKQIVIDQLVQVVLLSWLQNNISFPMSVGTFLFSVSSIL